MNIWLISLFDPTPIDNSATERFVGIAKAAVKRGHNVTHFTSTFRHTSKKHRFPKSEELNINASYQVNFIHSPGYKKNIHPKRFIAHWVFANTLIKTLSKKQKPDIIFISMPPLSTVSKVVSWGKNNNVPVVMDIIDPWPDSFIKDIPKVLKPISKIFFNFFYSKLTTSLKTVTALSAISKGYIDWALQHVPKDNIPTDYFYPAVNYRWIREKMNEIANEGIKKGDKLRIIYAGSLASSYDIPCICKAAEYLDSEYPGKTEFIILGSGPQEVIVKFYSEKLSNLTFIGWTAREELMRYYYSSDLGLIQHKNSLPRTVTYKLFSYLSAGLPVLNSPQSEMVSIVTDNKVGLNNKEGDYKALSTNIAYFIVHPEVLTEYKKNALQFTAEKGDSEVVYDNLTKYLEGIYEGKINSKR